MTARRKAKTRLAMGTGLMALDAVVSEGAAEPEQCYTGGTCANVLLALQFLGWTVRPVCRLGIDEAAATIIADLDHWKVQRRNITQDAAGSTPVIVQRISRGAGGQAIHRFSWRCPSCGSRYPGYKPVLGSVAQRIAEKVERVEAFFFDRVSRGALILAQACADAGGVVVFEPSGVGNPALFAEAVEIAHVIKYSHERLPDIPAELDESESIRLQIETLGEEGLRYRLRRGGRSASHWTTLDAFSVDYVVDTAGAGDWCTAGIVSKVAKGGLSSFDAMSGEEVRKAIRYGQALGAWTCGFQGARGGMYAVSQRTFARQVRRILKGQESREEKVLQMKRGHSDAFASLCLSCKPAGAKRRHG